MIGRMRLLVALLLGVTLVPALQGCVTGTDADRAVRAELQQRLEGRRSWQAIFRRSRARAAVDERDVAPLVQAFYRARRWDPVWVEGGKLNDRAHEAVELLAEGGKAGLGPADDDARAMATLVDSLDTGMFEKKPTIVALARAELMLTRELMQYARHRSSGRVDPRLLPADWHVQPRKVDVVAAVAEAVGGNLDRTLARLDPPHPEFAQLRDARARYAEVAAAGGWKAIPAGPTLKRGSTGPRVALLRQRLAATGELDRGAAEGVTFDPAVEKAVARFQHAIGVEGTGQVGKVELAALNVPAQRRLEQIELNLERWRWVPAEFGDRTLLINIPGYALEVREGGRPVMSMRVVVGKEFTPTPMLSDQITHVVINPYWNVPESIASEEILVELQRDPGYLARNQMRLFEHGGEDAAEVDPARVDWTMVAPGDFKYRIRQDPGPLNSVGRLKFVMTNPYDIYLHDTPAEQLFARNARNFSHGCVRLEKPLDLAAHLLKGHPEWDASSIEAAFETAEDQWVKLREPMPVHIVYWTAWADADGGVHFRDDVYELDRTLSEVLKGRNPRAPVTAGAQAIPRAGEASTARPL